MSTEALLEFRNVSKSIHGPAGSKVRILNNVNLCLDKSAGGIVSFLSYSASELTTLLKIMAKVENNTQGEILLNGKEYSSTSGKIAYIPELPSSFPWLNVKQNVEFSLTCGNGKNINPELVDKAIALAGLESYGSHFPDNKSLGFRFRISLARAIAAEPEIILLNEPLKNLHGETKKEIFNLIVEASKQTNIKFITGLTNTTEAILLSDKIFLMRRHPGTVEETIDIDKSKDVTVHSDYFHSLKNSIEKILIGYENNPLQ